MASQRNNPQLVQFSIYEHPTTWAGDATVIEHRVTLLGEPSGARSNGGG